MPEQTTTALQDLKDRRFGTAEFLIDQDGNPVHVESVFTSRLNAGESLADFFARAKIEGAWRHGDRIQVPAQDGKTEYVRIIRPAA
jgi:hypothetical protein